jgi:hypothetical protein
VPDHALPILSYILLAFRMSFIFVGCDGYDMPVDSHLLAAGLLAIAEMFKHRVFHELFLLLGRKDDRNNRVLFWWVAHDIIGLTYEKDLTSRALQTYIHQEQHQAGIRERRAIEGTSI